MLVPRDWGPVSLLQGKKGQEKNLDGEEARHCLFSLHIPLPSIPYYKVLCMPGHREVVIYDNMRAFHVLGVTFKKRLLLFMVPPVTHLKSDKQKELGSP